MDKLPARLIGRIAHMIEEIVREAVQEHERRYHAIAPPEHSPTPAIPFASHAPSGDHIHRAIEMIEDATDDEALARRRRDECRQACES